MNTIKHIVISLLAVLAAILLTEIAGAQENTRQFKQLKGEALRAVFSGALMTGEYRDYREQTKTFRYTELHRANGTTDYKEGKTLTMPGIWTIVGSDKICYKYPKSGAPKRTHCFFVFAHDKCYYKYGLWQMTLRGPRDWDIWTSRALVKGDGGSCAAPLS